MKDPTELSIHPVAKGLPEWGKEDPRFIALLEDIRTRGIDQPLIIDKQNRIMDGRHRWRAAKQLQLDEVPVIVRSEEEVFGIVVNSLLQRRHHTKSQLAYLTYPLMKDAFDEAHRRMLENLKKGNNSRSTLSGLRAKTVEDLADQIGISRALFFQAKEVHQVFGKDQAKYEFQTDDGPIEKLTLKEFFERRILDAEKPAGLGAVLAGIAGMKATKGKAKHNPEQLDLFEGAFDVLSKRFVYWQKFDAEDKAKCKEIIRHTVAAMPQDLRAEFAAALREVEKAKK